MVMVIVVDPLKIGMVDVTDRIVSHRLQLRGIMAGTEILVKMMTDAIRVNSSMKKNYKIEDVDMTALKTMKHNNTVDNIKKIILMIDVDGMIVLTLRKSQV
jgi:hypothetical protein